MEIQVTQMDQLLDDELPGRPALVNHATVEGSSGQTAEMATDHDAEEGEQQGNSLQGERVASGLAPETTSSPTSAKVTSGSGADQGSQGRVSQLPPFSIACHSGSLMKFPFCGIFFLRRCAIPPVC